MVEVLRDGGIVPDEVVKLVERPRLLSEAQLGNNSEWMSEGSGFLAAAGVLGLTGKVMEMHAVLPSGDMGTLVGIVFTAKEFTTKHGRPWWLRRPNTVATITDPKPPSTLQRVHCWSWLIPPLYAWMWNAK